VIFRLARDELAVSSGDLVCAWSSRSLHVPYRLVPRDGMRIRLSRYSKSTWKLDFMLH